MRGDVDCLLSLELSVSGEGPVDLDRLPRGGAGTHLREDCVVSSLVPVKVDAGIVCAVKEAGENEAQPSCEQPARRRASVAEKLIWKPGLACAKMLSDTHQITGG